VFDYELVPALECASIGDYVSLFAMSFAGDNKLSAKYLYWQYSDNPHGQVIGFDAFYQGELVAHYAVIPRQYVINNQIIKAALSVNTATHPSHQGKGLFVKLATATYDLAANRGVQFVTGAANVNSIKGFERKLGFTSLGQIRIYLAKGGPMAREDELSLMVDPDWLVWRVKNPSREIIYVQHGNGTTTLRANVRSLQYNLTRLDTKLFRNKTIDVKHAGYSSLLPCLTPHFGHYPPNAVCLPLRLQPSPWHVIWRCLDDSLNHDLANHIRFDGLAMDTF
jgi:GNAT superfamily N-acetyltransferase